MLKFHNKKSHFDTVIYIIHGLNQKTSVWTHWVNALTSNSKNTVVFIAELNGHKPTESLNNYSYGLWYDQVQKDISTIFNEYESCSIHIIAYSLGGLLAIDVLTDLKLKPNRLCLIAPALIPHKMVMSFSKIKNHNLLKKIIIPSFSPKKVRVHNGISLYVYQQIASASLQVSQKLNFLKSEQIFVVFDKKDELLNTTKTYKLFYNSSLAHQWIWTKSKGNGLGRHHLLPAKKYLDKMLFEKFTSNLNDRVSKKEN